MTSHSRALMRRPHNRAPARVVRSGLAGRVAQHACTLDMQQPGKMDSVLRGELKAMHPHQRAQEIYGGTASHATHAYTRVLIETSLTSRTHGMRTTSPKTATPNLMTLVSAGLLRLPLPMHAKNARKPSTDRVECGSRAVPRQHTVPRYFTKSAVDSRVIPSYCRVPRSQSKQAPDPRRHTRVPRCKRPGNRRLSHVSQEPKTSHRFPSLDGRPCCVASAEADDTSTSSCSYIFCGN